MDDAILGGAVYAAIVIIGLEGEATRATVAEGLVFALETVRRDDIARIWCLIRFAGQWVLQPWYSTYQQR